MAMSSTDDSSSEEDFGGSSSQRKVINRNKKRSVFDDDSSSSSDEFERVPECLDDLTDINFKVNEKAELGKTTNTSSPSKVLDETSCGSQSKEPAPQVEYYDFSQILQSQQELKHVAEKVASYKNTDSSESKSRKKVAPKPSNARKRRNVKPSKVDSANPDGDDIEELLRVGERIETKSKSKKSKQAQEEDMILVTDQLDSDNDVDEDQEESTQDVEIKLSIPNIHYKKRKNRDLRNLIESAKAFNESRRIIQADMHKVSLLGNLSHGFLLNSLANADELQALALSIIPNKTFYPPPANTLSFTEKITKWFNKKFLVDYSKMDVTLEIAIEDFSRQKASNLKTLVVMFVALCRQIGLKCRLLMCLQPCPIKPHSSELMRIPKETEDEEEECSPSKKTKKEKDGKSVDKVGPSTSQSKQSSSQSKRSSSRKKKTSEVASNSKSESTSKKTNSKSRKGQNSSPSESKKQNSTKKTNRKVLSTDDSEEEIVNSPTRKKGVDFWAEVFIEAEEMWAPADVVRGQVNNTTAIGNGVTSPLAYIVGWNSDGTVKDLTRRYSPNWLTTVPKLRTDPKWWKRTLAPWAPKITKLEKLENKKLDEEEAAAPIPTRIQDCKNHPFYALKRHLLKFEAIYPPDAKPIAFVRGEEVYSRVCVTELHTKETWMRQGKALKVNEEPYKIVKARPKWDKVSSSVIKDLPLPLYGYWQVDDYIAPPAVDGVVPKNEYGNVEVYRPSMLPAGTVHLRVPGMAKVARKLGIDFAPAVVGWEYHGGSSHPTIDGIIVCEEHQDALSDAWNAAVDNDIEKEMSKSRTRAIKNWKKLIRLVIIRRRLEKKYKLSLSNVK